MKHRHACQGFTLVELAIVMTIIGLLIGGILKGQEMILNSRVTATVAQLQGYQAAVTSFRDVYDAFPGDFMNAPTRLPGCTLGCTPAAQNNYIGNPARAIWDASMEYGDCTFQTPGNQVLPNPGHRGGQETWLFWQHLSQANLISGITDAGVQAVTPFSINVTHPETKMGGAFWARTNRTGELPTGSTSTDPTAGPQATVMLLLMRNANITLQGGPSLTTKAASMIDTKMDDGNASAGIVQGMYATCYAAGNNSSYNTSNGAANQCGLAIGLVK